VGLWETNNLWGYLYLLGASFQRAEDWGYFMWLDKKPNFIEGLGDEKIFRWG